MKKNMLLVKSQRNWAIRSGEGGLSPPAFGIVLPLTGPGRIVPAAPPGTHPTSSGLSMGSDRIVG
jgi:hypothetical protein